MTAPRRINLLPPELKERRRSRQTTTAMVAALAILAGVLGVVYAAQEVRLRGERGTLAEQQERNAALESEVAELREFEQLERELEDKTTLVAEVSASEVRWSVLLADVSLVIPSDVWLTSLNGSVTGAVEEGEEGEEDTEASLGQIQLSGATFSHPDVARWLTRLDSVDAFIFPYLSLSARSTIADTPVVTFSSSVQLSEQALRRNQGGARRRL